MESKTSINISTRILSQLLDRFTKSVTNRLPHLLGTFLPHDINVDIILQDNFLSFKSFSFDSLPLIIEFLIRWKNNIHPAPTFFPQALSEQDNEVDKQLCEVCADIVFCQTLLVCLREMRVNVPARLSLTLEKLAFSFFESEAKVPRIGWLSSPTLHANLLQFRWVELSDLWTKILGMLSQNRIDSIHVEFLRDIDYKSPDTVSKLIRGLSGIKLDISKPELLEQSCSLIENLFALLQNPFVKKTQARYSTLYTLYTLLFPMSEFYWQEDIDYTSWFILLANIYEKMEIMSMKDKHKSHSLPVQTAVICSCEQEFFLTHYRQLLYQLINIIQEKINKSIGFTCLQKLIDVYLSKMSGRKETTLIHLRDLSKKIILNNEIFLGEEMSRINHNGILILILTIAKYLPDFILKLITENLDKSNLNSLAHPRTLVFIRALCFIYEFKREDLLHIDVYPPLEKSDKTYANYLNSESYGIFTYPSLENSTEIILFQLAKDYIRIPTNILDKYKESLRNSLYKILSQISQNIGDFLLIHSEIKFPEDVSSHQFNLISLARYVIRLSAVMLSEEHDKTVNLTLSEACRFTLHYDVQLQNSAIWAIHTLTSNNESVIKHLCLFICSLPHEYEDVIRMSLQLVCKLINNRNVSAEIRLYIEATSLLWLCSLNKSVQISSLDIINTLDSSDLKKIISQVENNPNIVGKMKSTFTLNYDEICNNDSNNIKKEEKIYVGRKLIDLCESNPTAWTNCLANIVRSSLVPLREYTKICLDQVLPRIERINIYINTSNEQPGEIDLCPQWFNFAIIGSIVSPFYYNDESKKIYNNCIKWLDYPSLSIKNLVVWALGSVHPITSENVLGLIQTYFTNRKDLFDEKTLISLAFIYRLLSENIDKYSIEIFSIYDPYIQFLVYLTKYLTSNENFYRSDLHVLRIHLCIVLNKFAENAINIHDTFDTNLRKFFFEKISAWSHYGKLTEDFENKISSDRLNHTKKLKVEEILDYQNTCNENDRILIYSSLQAMSSLLNGPCFDENSLNNYQLSDKFTMPSSIIYSWLDLILDSQDTSIVKISQKAVSYLLDSNSVFAIHFIEFSYLENRRRSNILFFALSDYFSKLSSYSPSDKELSRLMFLSFFKMLDPSFECRSISLKLLRSLFRLVKIDVKLRYTLTGRIHQRYHKEQLLISEDLSRVLGKHLSHYFLIEAVERLTLYHGNKLALIECITPWLHYIRLGQDDNDEIMLHLCLLSHELSDYDINWIWKEISFFPPNIGNSLDFLVNSSEEKFSSFSQFNTEASFIITGRNIVYSLFQCEFDLTIKYLTSKIIECPNIESVPYKVIRGYHDKSSDSLIYATKDLNQCERSLLYVTECAGNFEFILPLLKGETLDADKKLNTEVFCSLLNTSIIFIDSNNQLVRTNSKRLLMYLMQILIPANDKIIQLIDYIFDNLYIEFWQNEYISESDLELKSTSKLSDFVNTVINLFPNPKFVMIWSNQSLYWINHSINIHSTCRLLQIYRSIMSFSQFKIDSTQLDKIVFTFEKVINMDIDSTLKHSLVSEYIFTIHSILLHFNHSLVIKQIRLFWLIISLINYNSPTIKIFALKTLYIFLQKLDLNHVQSINMFEKPPKNLIIKGLQHDIIKTLGNSNCYNDSIKILSILQDINVYSFVNPLSNRLVLFTLPEIIWIGTALEMKSVEAIHMNVSSKLSLSLQSAAITSSIATIGASLSNLSKIISEYNAEMSIDIFIEKISPHISLILSTRFDESILELFIIILSNHNTNIYSLSFIKVALKILYIIFSNPSYGKISFKHGKDNLYNIISYQISSLHHTLNNEKRGVLSILIHRFESDPALITDDDLLIDKSDFSVINLYPQIQDSLNSSLYPLILPPEYNEPSTPNSYPHIAPTPDIEPSAPNLSPPSAPGITLTTENQYFETPRRNSPRKTSFTRHGKSPSSVRSVRFVINKPTKPPPPSRSLTPQPRRKERISIQRCATPLPYKSLRARAENVIKKSPQKTIQKPRSSQLLAPQFGENYKLTQSPYPNLKPSSILKSNSKRSPQYSPKLPNEILAGKFRSMLQKLSDESYEEEDYNDISGDFEDL